MAIERRSRRKTGTTLSFFQRECVFKLARIKRIYHVPVNERFHGQGRPFQWQRAPTVDQRLSSLFSPSAIVLADSHDSRWLLQSFLLAFLSTHRPRKAMKRVFQGALKTFCVGSALTTLVTTKKRGKRDDAAAAITRNVIHTARSDTFSTGALNNFFS